MFKPSRYLGPVISTLLVVLPAAAAQGEQTGAPRWSITPYIWATETTVDLSFRDTNVGTEVSFSDLLDVLDVLDQGDELVAAEPCQGVVAAHDARQGTIHGLGGHGVPVDPL